MKNQRLITRFTAAALLLLAAPGLAAAGLADDHLLRFRQDNPDLVVQLGASPSQAGYLFSRVRDQLIASRGLDPLARPVDLPLMEIKSGMTLDTYLDARLARMIRDTLRIRLSEIRTTIDAYRLGYRLGQPVLGLKSAQQAGDALDLTLSFRFHKVEIDVDNILVSNQSPGVKITRQADDEGRIHVSGADKMTFVDDIYLRLRPEDGQPILAIETAETEPSVVSGEIGIRVHRSADGVIRLSHRSNAFDFFEGASSAPYADKIRVSIGSSSKVGGLDAIEIGRSELRMQFDVAAFAAKKRAFLSDVVGSHLAEAIRGLDLTDKLVDEFSRLSLQSTDLRPVGQAIAKKTGDSRFASLGLRSELNTVGVLGAENPDRQQIHLSSNHSLLWLDNAFTPADTLPFPLTSPLNHGLSLSTITEEIRSGRADLVVSLGQDYLNHSVHVATRGHLELPNDPTTRSDDIISNGRKGVFLMLDGPEQQGRLVVDIMVKPRFFQAVGLAVATFRTKLYFPLVIVPELKVEEVAGVPNLVVRVADIDLSEETLRRGIDGVASNLNRGISRKLVLKKVRKILSPMIGRTIQTLPLQGLEGVSPESVIRLESDHLGRLNLMLRYDSRELPRVMEAIVSRKRI